MGTYVNPRTESMKLAVNSEIYVDKTGLLKILNNFTEYTMTTPGELVSYFGFTQQEVEKECRNHEMDPGIIGKWYDGYYMYAFDPRKTPLKLLMPLSVAVFEGGENEKAVKHLRFTAFYRRGGDRKSLAFRSIAVPWESRGKSVSCSIKCLMELAR